MRETLVHRGPEEAGGVEIQSVSGTGSMRGWFGHRRLRVLDLTPAADQPMRSDDGNVTLTYNGEVYNFRELRQELHAGGYRFSSTGDTEVVLRAYEAWGADFVERLDGMFAIALWDARLGRLLLARDRTGKKPLFYAELRGRLTFGSEIKALLAAPWVERRADEKMIGRFLTYGYAPHPSTMFEGIRQLSPASVLLYDGSGTPVVRRYWSALPQTAGGARPQPTVAEAATRIRVLLEEAIRRRMIADVPMGALLSGGIDSSLVVAMMTRHAQEPVRTFSAGFVDDSSFDERRYARLISQRFSTVHEEFEVRADAASLLDRLLWHHDQPFADSSAIPTYLICELARQRVTVVLNGDGGDEVFGGYDRFRAVALADALPEWPLPMLRALKQMLPRTGGYYSLRRRLERFLEYSDEDPKHRYQSWIAVMNDDLLREMLPDDLLGEESWHQAPMAESYARAAALPVLDQVLLANFESYLPDDLAVKMDRMSMAHSLEARSPFLDTALIEYLAGVPAKHKVGMFRLKPLLRRACWTLLPREIWDRRKHGFGVPVGRWFQAGELRQIFEDEVLADAARTRAYLDQALVARMWSEHQHGLVEHGFRFWALLTLERWLRTLERPVPVAAPRVQLSA